MYSSSQGCHIAISKAARKPLVAIILSILKCVFYSRTIGQSRKGGEEPARPPLNPPLMSLGLGLSAGRCQGGSILPTCSDATIFDIPTICVRFSGCDSLFLLRLAVLDASYWPRSLGCTLRTERGLPTFFRHFPGLFNTFVEYTRQRRKQADARVFVAPKFVARENTPRIRVRGRIGA